jgi:hypothetical protein
MELPKATGCAVVPDRGWPSSAFNANDGIDLPGFDRKGRSGPAR